MIRSLRVLAILAVASAAVLIQVGTAQADDPNCPFPATLDVYAYQQTPEATMLGGRVDPGVNCPSSGIISRLDGSEQLAVGEGFFELPLATRSGEWYLSSYTVGTDTRTFEPVAPYLVEVRNLTRITSTAPDTYTGYAEHVTVSGVLEGWSAGTGWQPLPGRDLLITTGFPPHLPVPTTTDASGAYSLSVPLYTSFVGNAVFAGDHAWARSTSFSFAQVHGLLSVEVSDRTPGVGQRVRINGKVAPAGVPVWLERLVGTTWTRVTPVVTSDADGKYQLAYRPTVRGAQQYRVWNDGTEPESRMGVLPFFKEFKLSVHR